MAENNRADKLPKSWDPATVESTLYQEWVDRGYFTADVNSPKPAFSIVLPPPNVTGQLHMGHALDHTLMDAIARRKRMQGYEVLWLPGMDHAGTATTHSWTRSGSGCAVLPPPRLAATWAWAGT